MEGRARRREESGATWKFLLLSAAGLILFFIPVCRGNIPLVLLINELKTLLGERLPLLSGISCLILGGGAVLSLLLGKGWIKDCFSGAGPRLYLWILAAVLFLLKLFHAPLFFLEDPRIGGRIFDMGATVFITIAVAGSLVIFIIQSGLVDFIAVLSEPFMRPLFCLPGEAAVNILSSFVSSASVGVYLTEQYYKRGSYTKRQACAVVANYSVISVGYIGVIASLAGIGERYGSLLIASFLSVLIMGAIMVRMPPISGIEDCLIDGRRKEEKTERISPAERFRLALLAGRKCAESFGAETFLKNLKQSLLFSQKIVGVMIPVVTFVLILVYYTPIFYWLGRPVTPLLALVRLPDPALAAPSVLIEIVEVSLPSVLIGQTEAGVQTRFFVALLSIIQIIFFSEAGNAILASEIPLGVRKLVMIFLIRTLIGIGIAAVFARFFCG